MVPVRSGEVMGLQVGNSTRRCMAAILVGGGEMARMVAEGLDRDGAGPREPRRFEIGPEQGAQAAGTPGSPATPGLSRGPSSLVSPLRKEAKAFFQANLELCLQPYPRLCFISGSFRKSLCSMAQTQASPLTGARWGRGVVTGPVPHTRALHVYRSTMGVGFCVLGLLSVHYPRDTGICL